MVYPKFIVSNQKGESISLKRVDRNSRNMSMYKIHRISSSFGNYKLITKARTDN